jgi:tRNA dimethylallyltransferase
MVQDRRYSFEMETGPIFLLGATALGKSAVALELARREGGAAILALDAMQVYRGADIGTSKPSLAEREEIPHGGLDLAEFGESFDVARYLAHAASFLRAQREARRRVIVVGGTGLYFRALTRGLCEAPQGPEGLRAELAALSVEALRIRLGRVDPAMLGKLDASNPRRLARAIEVMETSGRSLREWQAETPAPLVADFTAFWLQRGKDELEARMAARVEAMFAAGWVEEVRGLVERHGAEAVRAFPAIGYREIAELSAGGTSLAAVKRDILAATRQYARRQLTWFAREPSLRGVMLSGNQPFPAALLSLS